LAENFSPCWNYVECFFEYAKESKELNFFLFFIHPGFASKSPADEKIGFGCGGEADEVEDEGWERRNVCYIDIEKNGEWGVGIRWTLICQSYKARLWGQEEVSVALQRGNFDFCYTRLNVESMERNKAYFSTQLKKKRKERESGANKLK
jgi:hypothetical protein